MKYKHNLLALLSASAVTMALLAGCGEDTSDPPSGTAGTAGAAGAAAGAAGTAGAAAGTAGTAGSTDAGAGGTAGKGGGAGGKAGAAGKAGGAGSSTSDAVANIGVECTEDADCGDGGKCLKADGTDILSGGPANGMCTIDCSAWLALSDEEKQTAAYPCNPEIDPADPNAAITNLCLNFAASDTDPPLGYCTQLCEFGQPPLEQFGAEFDPNKCGGRKDVVCYPSTDDKNVYQGAFCRPLCQSDDQCGGDLKCDKQSGVCKTEVPSKKKNGDLCKLTLNADGSIDPNAESECESGLCLRLYDFNDPATPASKKNVGLCFDTCIYGDINESCGGLNNGLCIFDLFGPSASEGGESIPAGLGDLGGCAKTNPTKQDSLCPWTEGWFTRGIFGGQVQVCLPAGDCTSDDTCAFTCNTDADCGDGDKCECFAGNKCDCDPTTDPTCSSKQCRQADGKPNTGGRTCRQVPEYCGKSVCLDHDPKGLDSNDPNLDCTGVAGAGGAGGAAGAAGAAGEAGAAGAAAGAAGAAAGAAGAAAGAAGEAGAAGAAAGAGGANLFATALLSSRRGLVGDDRTRREAFCLLHRGSHAPLLSFCTARRVLDHPGLYLRLARRDHVDAPRPHLVERRQPLDPAHPPGGQAADLPHACAAELGPAAGEAADAGLRERLGFVEPAPAPCPLKASQGAGRALGCAAHGDHPDEPRRHRSLPRPAR